MTKPTSEQMERLHALVDACVITEGVLERFLLHQEAKQRRSAEALALTVIDPLNATAEQRAFRLKLDLAGSGYVDVLIPCHPGDRSGTRLRNVVANLALTVDGVRVTHVSIRMLVQCTEPHALRRLGLGEKGVAVLKERLALAGLRFGMTAADVERAFGPKPEFSSEQKRAHMRQLLDRRGRLYPGLLLQLGTPSAQTALRILSAMTVPNKMRLVKPLVGTPNVISIRELVRIPKCEFLKIKGVNAEVVQCIEDALEAVGLRMGMRVTEIEEAFRPGAAYRTVPDHAAAAT